MAELQQASQTSAAAARIMRVSAPLLLHLRPRNSIYYTQQSKLAADGIITFLVLLGTSTMVDKVASSNFYLRIAQIL